MPYPWEVVSSDGRVLLTCETRKRAWQVASHTRILVGAIHNFDLDVVEVRPWLSPLTEKNI